MERWYSHPAFRLDTLIYGSQICVLMYICIYMYIHPFLNHDFWGGVGDVIRGY